MKYPKPLLTLIDELSRLPSVGKKTAERYAIHIFQKFSKDECEKLAQAVVDVKSIGVCKSCGNICEGELCSICSDPERDKRIVMVVETIKDLFVMENINEYRGIYHVLGGAISFAKGIGIDDLNISSLIEKVKNNEVNEIILATNATLEGETTARYIKALLGDYDVNITRIAHGLPVGGDLAYADEMTILKALEGRKKYE